MRCVSRVIHRFMRNVGIAGMSGRGVQISTDLSAIERRVGLACAVAKLNRGGDSRKKPPPKGSGTIVKHRILLLYYLKDQ